MNNLRKGVDFIRAFKTEKDKAFGEGYGDKHGRVYIHCKGGHGRSASVALAWMCYLQPSTPLETLNGRLCDMRRVRKKMYNQKELIEFRKGVLDEGESKEEDSFCWKDYREKWGDNDIFPRNLKNKNE